MTKRAAFVAIVVVLAAGALYWTIARRAPARPGAAASAEQQAQDRERNAWLALRIQVFAAGPDDDVLIAVSAYDRRARQAELVRAAAPAGYRGSAASHPVAALRPVPQGWRSRMRLEAAGVVLPHAVMTATEAGSAVLRVQAAQAPRLPAAIVAVLPYDEAEARSNTVVLERTPLTPADRLVALGAQAELVADLDRLAAIGTELVALDPSSPWGHYFTGVALEPSGQRDAALAAFRRALALTEPSFEPPIGLVARIRGLQGR